MIEKKEKAFKSKDVYKWGLECTILELEKMKDHLLNDKEKAFDVMFLKETDELEFKRQELGFYDEGVVCPRNLLLIIFN